LPSRILCPECEAAFAYSPALLGRTVRCRQCQHTFKISAPPPERPAAGAADSQPAEPPAAAAPPPVRPVPPPLPPTVLPDPPRRSLPRSRRDDDFDDDRPRSRDRDGDDFPQSRRSRAPKSQVGSGVLFVVVAAFVFLFLVLAVGVGYLLWPTSPPTNATAQSSAAANDRGAAIEPPKNLEQVMKNEPDRPGVPALPPLAPPGPVVAPPPMPAPGPMVVPPQFDANPRTPPVPVPMPRPPDRPRRPADPPRPIAMAAPKFTPVAPLAIQTTPLGADREQRNLAGPVENAVAAGGGRLLLLHMPREKLVAVFDVNTGWVAKHIPADDSNAIVAGGMNMFVIYLPGKDVLERYNCTTLEREAELKSPFGAEVMALAMGSESNGPLAAALAGARIAFHGGATVCYFDPMTGKEIHYEDRGRPPNPFGIGDRNLKNIAIRMSANGLVATGWGTGGAIQSDVIEGGRLNHHWKLGAVESLIPTADGQALIDRGRRLSVEMAREPDGRPGRQGEPWLIPAVHGDFHVALHKAGSRSIPLESQQASADIHLGLESKALLKVGELRNFELPGDFDARGKTFDRNVFLVPDAKLLAVIPTKNRDQLVLYRADLDKALSTAGFEYLLVTSRPQTAAVKGETYRYTLTVKSKKGGIKVTLENGPEGMTATPTGTIDWQVPRDLADTEVGVRVRVADASGKEVSHSYRLRVTEKTEKSPQPKKN